MAKIKINPFKGLTVIQTNKDLDLVQLQFGEPHEKRKTFLMCGDCGSTNLLLKVIVEADMVVDINDEVVNMKNEHVQAIKVLGCALCDKTNIVPFNAPKKEDKGEKERLVPRNVKEI